MSDHMNNVIEVDACHQPCPMPILMLKRALKTAPTGTIFLVKATDKHSQQDLPQFCQAQGLQLIKNVQEGMVYYYFIERN